MLAAAAVLEARSLVHDWLLLVEEAAHIREDGRLLHLILLH